MKKFWVRTALITGFVAATGMASVPAVTAAEQEKHTEVVDLSYASGKNLKLTVDSMCRRGKIVFRMKNDGASWPGMANLSVIDAISGVVLTGRSMKLKNNQSAGFSIRPQEETETLSLRIEAAWLPEAYEHDVGQGCS